MLGIPETIGSVTQNMIERAYRKKSLSMHPDKLGKVVSQEEKDAFNELGDNKAFLLSLPQFKQPHGGSMGTKCVNAKKSRSRRVKRRKTRHVRRTTRHHR